MYFRENKIKSVNLLAGVIDTNAYIIGENPNKDVDLQVGNYWAGTKGIRRLRDQERGSAKVENK